MADVFSKKKRSDVMSRIRSKNTVIELTVFRRLRKRGVYFQKHYDKAPGKPDIALPRKKLAVFIDGDFWHGRDFLKRKQRLPIFWQEKIASNMRRDRRTRLALKKDGWMVLRIWEKDIEKRPDKTLARVIAFLLNEE